VFTQEALFCRRIRTGIFGARFGPIPDDLREKLQRNTGAFVILVVESGPAFKANVMRGDVVLQIADRPVATYDELLKVLPAYAGRKTRFTVIRDLRPLDIEVELNDGK
jgi:S1-C subfamily serine protease